MPVSESPTAADLRAEVARHRLPLYRLAPHVNMHPAHLGRVLNGARELTPALAERIQVAIERETVRDERQ